MRCWIMQADVAVVARLVELGARISDVRVSLAGCSPKRGDIRKAVALNIGG